MTDQAQDQGRTTAAPGGTGVGTTRLDDDELAPYLVHHLLAAASGVRLFRTVSGTWRGTEHGPALRRLTADVDADRRELASLVHRLGYRVPPVRRVLGIGSAVVARLDPINPLRRRGTQSAQMELEALESAVDMKESLWDTLLALPGGTGLDRAALQRLQDRAGDQRERLTAIRRATAAARFLR
ncbi:hypothetical protein [Tersicoccus sp. Bi-70]|uniref:hypothetical protein n=1 Tax=Tersicoccus sp. Bi-70 TaxID=1897634 RepID=UPI0009777B92|nr:hypothetical protein [Tersicoccus sp. Bi-70]OMH31217.1 hypothetical protein BGP79_09200 [Tersicoccus sp. Bi-70]